MLLIPASAAATTTYQAYGEPDDLCSDDDAVFRLGEPSLDLHHGRMLCCLRQLVAVDGRYGYREKLAAAAGDLFETWIAHCDAEKALMQASAWRERSRHLADHNRLTLALSNLLYRHTQADRDAQLEKMATFFICYLVDHLHRYDRPLAQYLRECREGSERPVPANDTDAGTGPA